MLFHEAVAGRVFQDAARNSISGRGLSQSRDNAAAPSRFAQPRFDADRYHDGSGRAFQRIEDFAVMRSPPAAALPRPVIGRPTPV
jgi:hypothetical protein